MTDRSDRVGALLAHTLGEGRVPGLAVAVAADGSIATTQVAGIADAGNRARITSNTAFLWFSMTKIVTATAAMRLVDEGRLVLDDVVDDLVPGVLPPDAKSRVRVRHLLQHSAGIPNPVPVRWVRLADAPPPDPDA